MTQPAGAVDHHPRIVPDGGWQGGEQRFRVWRITLQGKPRLCLRAVRRIEPRDLPCCRWRVMPGEALEPRPLVILPNGAGPAVQECRLGCRVSDAGEPGIAGLFRCPRIVPGIRPRLGATQHGLRHGQPVAFALRQRRCLVGFRGDGLLPATLQQCLARPIRVLRHEVGNLVSRRGPRREQTEISDELGCDRIGVGCGGELCIGPPVSTDRRDRIAGLRQGRGRGEQGNQSVTGANRGTHGHLSSPVRPCGASVTRLASPAQSAGSQTQGRGSCSKDRSLL